MKEKEHWSDTPVVPSLGKLCLRCVKPVTYDFYCDEHQVKKRTKRFLWPFPWRVKDDEERG